MLANLRGAMRERPRRSESRNTRNDAAAVRDHRCHLFEQGKAKVGPPHKEHHPVAF